MKELTKKEAQAIAKKLLNEHPIDIIAAYMDDGIREEVHYLLAPCSDLKFVTEYIYLHSVTFHETFEIN